MRVVGIIQYNDGDRYSGCLYTFQSMPLSLLDLGTIQERWLNVDPTIDGIVIAHLIGVSP